MFFQWVCSPQKAVQVKGLKEATNAEIIFIEIITLKNVDKDKVRKEVQIYILVSLES